MQPPTNFNRIIDRKRYSVKTATLVAGDDYHDGHNWERQGRNTFLYKTPKGAYFTVSLTCWQGERDTLLAVSLEDAIELYEGDLTEQRLTYKEAFPGVEVQDA